MTNPNRRDAYWMPFTASQSFAANPRLLTKAHGVIYQTDDGRELIDGTGGLWCCNAGHAHPLITAAIKRQADQLDFVHSFNQGHEIAFEAANRLVALADGFDHVFFVNSGSEAVDTALKIALAFHAARGQGQRRILVGRQKAYHGVNFGGLSVGGIGANKAQFGTLYPSTVHMRHTSLTENAFSRGMPPNGAALADDLQALCDLHGAQNIAAVIVEPVAGAGGVLPPPIGYLERLREICDQTGILLIFDEVVTGFGRLGMAFGYQKFGVMPDMITVAKGMTNATVPMGGVLVTADMRAAFLNGPTHLPDLFHGYTYSGHPLACAAAIATLDAYQDGAMFENAAAMAPLWENMLHRFCGHRAIADVRNIGLLGALQLRPDDEVGAAGRTFYRNCWDRGLVVRPIGDTVAMSPPLTITPELIDQIGR
ncbi:MAG: aminotransferase class III-fold pyridoxal phosphate-dependent enzyme, partial [Paracoccaceae bacterium]